MRENEVWCKVVGDMCNRSKFGYVQGFTSKNKIYVGEHVHVCIWTVEIVMLWNIFF
jgi:hypothetical protein